MNWALFVFFNREGGRTSLIDLFFQDQYLNAIKTTSQHLLRYLTSAVILNKCPSNVFKELTRVVLTEEYNYKDPLTSFLLCLYAHYDLNRAAELLKDCDTVIENDFFLCTVKNEFAKAASLSVLESYCRLFSCINAGMVANQLDINQMTIERWIMLWISKLNLNGKIHHHNRRVIFTVQQKMRSRQVMKKVRFLSMKTYMLHKDVVKTTNMVL
jgi:translation initiation factor 3 subunit E